MFHTTIDYNNNSCHQRFRLKQWIRKLAMQLRHLCSKVGLCKFCKFNFICEGEDVNGKIHDGRRVDVRGIGRFLIDEFLKRER